MARDVSLCIPVYNQCHLLQRTLESIQRQDSQRLLEIIICDHGSTDDLPIILSKYRSAVRVVRRERQPGVVNAVFGRNPTYQHARGDIVLINSADIVHVTEGAIDTMAQLLPKQFNVATVWGTTPAGERECKYTGEGLPALCCLMAVWRQDLFAIGGDDEGFTLPAFDDYWLSDRLMHACNCDAAFPAVEAEHQWHSKNFQNQEGTFRQAEEFYQHKLKTAQRTGNWCSPTGPWPYEQGKALIA